MGKKWNINKQGILIGCAAVAGTLVLSTGFVTDSHLANGLVMGKVFWFHLSMLCMVACLFGLCFFEKELRFSFSLPDGLILGFAGITLATYNWS